MKKAKFLPAMLVTLLIGVGAAQAHDNAYLDSVKSANSGQVRVAGNYHYELVVVKTSKEIKDNPIMVYVTNHAGQKISTAGATGAATLLAGTEKSTATLVPDGDNRMKGSARYGSTPDMKGIISITLPGKSAEQARFTPMAVTQAHS